MRFHVAMFATWLLLNTTSPDPRDIANVDTGSIDDQFLTDGIEEVQKLYESLGADDQVAKGREFVEAVKGRLQQLTFTGRVS